MSEICLICLKNENSLVKVSENDENGKEILNQLKNCVPEIKWNLNIICRICEENLNKAYNFKQLCINSYTSWKKSLWPIVKSDETNCTNAPTSDNGNFLKEEKDFNFIFQCSNCYKTFETITELDLHSEERHSGSKKIENVINKTNDELSFFCKHDQFSGNDDGPSEGEKDSYALEKSSKTKSSIINRLKQKGLEKIGQRKKNFKCKNCNKTYVTRKGLERHTISCKEIEPEQGLPNELANLEEKTENTNFRTNIKDNFEEIDSLTPPICSICGTIFCNKYLLKRHLQNVHATEKKYKCDICGRTFASPLYLSAHKRYHIGDRSHICSFCGKGFITASDLYHHEKIHANKRAYRCEICPKAFNTSSDLHKHKICVHANRSEWKYVCTYCQKRFPLKTNLDTHVKTHTGEKNYLCHLCDRRCINKSVLSRHMETHSSVIAFNCNLCKQGYKYRKSLDLHLAKMHGVGSVKVPKATMKKFFCNLCPKSYFANSKFQKHVRSHTGERPFSCPNCDKSFVDKYYVKQHLKNTHNIVLIKAEF